MAAARQFATGGPIAGLSVFIIGGLDGEEGGDGSSRDGLEKRAAEGAFHGRISGRDRKHRAQIR